MLHSQGSADLILHNARVITMDSRTPRAELMAAKDGRILWVGSNRDLAELRGATTQVIDCQGQAVLPGFIDAHCHFLAYASSLLAVDCGPTSARSIAAIKDALHERAQDTPPGQWVRGAGYNEFYLEEKRHPNRWDLDEAVPHHPVRLNHRSGHACVLNSLALSLVGISPDTPDPSDGIIERDWDTGEPTGLLLEMNSYVDERIPPLTEDQMLKGVGLANTRLLSLGITSIQDATHTNSLERWNFFHRLKERRLLTPRATLMAGVGHLQDFRGHGLTFGSGDTELSLGAAKIVLTATTGVLQPTQEELNELVLDAHREGFQVAIHAIEAEAVRAAADAVANCSTVALRPAARHRIEHCSECPPAVLEELKGSGAVVVTQPAFLYYSGERYLAEVSKDVQPWLYRIRSFWGAGSRPAASSDTPVSPPSPMVGMYAAVTRRAQSGQVLSPEEAVSPRQALEMYTLAGAYAAFQERDRGSVEAGKLADLVVVDRDPTTVEPGDLKDLRVVLTVVGGRVVWER